MEVEIRTGTIIFLAPLSGVVPDHCIVIRGRRTSALLLPTHNAGAGPNMSRRLPAPLDVRETLGGLELSPFEPQAKLPLTLYILRLEHS